MKKLQHQLSNGSWINVGENRTTEFLDRCVKYNASIENHDSAIAAMESGKELRNHNEDWYSNCRMFDQQAAKERMRAAEKAHKERNRGRLTCKSCGQTGHSGQYPFSTLSSSGYCDDCL